VEEEKAQGVQHNLLLAICVDSDQRGRAKSTVCDRALQVQQLGAGLLRERGVVLAEDP
jgi:hypothetical protein